MKSHRAPSATVVLIFVATILVAPLMADTVRAQQSAPPGPLRPDVRDPTADARERQQREARLRSIELVGKAAPVDHRAAEAAAGQMKEDFKRIQVLRNEIARHLLSGRPLDYKFIADETEEINKRAGRLKTLLVREAAEGDEKDEKKLTEIGEGLMKDALVTLCKRIDSFTENPLFKVTDVVDVEQSAKAGKDLQTIVLLSDAVRKGAGRLNKTPRK